MIRACGILALALFVGCGQPPSSALVAVSPTPLPSPAPPSPTMTPTAVPTPPTTAAATVTPARSLADLLDEVKKAVVMIKTPQGDGSGFIFDKRGWVLTNAHVVGHFHRVTVTVESQGPLDRVSVIGQVISVDEEADLAFVLLESDRTYPELELGDPDQVNLGQDVIAIGFPLPDFLGEEISVTKGIVSSLRHIGKFDYVQTDAAITPEAAAGRSWTSAAG